jgi:uncharacterized Ntn-hydrolase superfamily protein
MTFSIVAFDPRAGEFGVAAQSKFLAVGAVVPWAAAGVGAVATQALANPSYGPDGLALLRKKMNPVDVVARLVSSDPERDLRQVAAIDTHGRTAAHTGSGCTPWAGHVCAKYFGVQGNLLAGDGVLRAMADGFERSEAELAVGMIAALRAGQRAGGDRRGQQSACLLVVRKGGGYGGFNDRRIDLRVDDHPEPIEELARLYRLHRLTFTRPRRQDLVRISGAVRTVVERCLRGLGYAAGLEEAVRDFHLNENLEERMIRPGYIDRDVLDLMKKKALEPDGRFEEKE